MFCEWCIDKLLEISDHCPICREHIVDYSYCLNTDNIIKRMIGQMPEKVQKKYKKIEALRAKDKPKSKTSNNLIFFLKFFLTYLIYHTIKFIWNAIQRF